MDDEVRPRDTQYPRVIFASLFGQMPHKGSLLHPGLPGSSFCVLGCVTVQYGRPSGKAGKRQSFISNLREFAKGYRCLLSALS